MSDMNKFLNKLQLEPGASLEQINNAYSMLVEQFSDNPTAEEEEHQQWLQNAYAVLHQACTSRQRKKVSIKINPRVLRGTMGGMALVVLVTLLILNFSGLQMMFNGYDPGDVLRWRTKQVPYGQVISYDRDHRFHTGEATGAYEIRLANRDETVWLSERVVVMGMNSMDPQEVQAAGSQVPGR